MWRYIAPELLKALDTEPENDVLYEILASLSGCIETLGAHCLDEHMMELLRIMDKLLTEHFERSQDRQKKHLDEDYDEVVQEQLEDEETDDIYVLSKIADVVHSLFLTYKENFLPFFDQICQHFVNLLVPQRPWADHQWGICIFDDLIEFTGPACVKYQHVFLQPLAVYLKDKSPEVRQAAAYGWGVLAQFGGNQFAHEMAKILPHMIEVINDPEAKDVRNINPTENAISAVTKILKYNSSAINVDELLPVWFSWLPVVEDADEAPHVYGYLCDLIEQNNQIVLGSGNDNIPRIIQIFAEAFFRDVLDPAKPSGVRVLSIIRQVQSNEQLFQGVVTALRPELQQALHMALHMPTSC